MTMRTWSIFWNSEQCVHLSLYGDNLFWTIQQFIVCVLTHQFCSLLIIWDFVVAVFAPHSALQVCLGEDAKEESNVVEVTAMNHQGKTISVPIANLHVNCLPMV